MGLAGRGVEFAAVGAGAADQGGTWRKSNRNVSWKRRRAGRRIARPPAAGSGSPRPAGRRCWARRWRWSRPPAGGDTASRSAENAPVVLISIDTLRADHLPAYGYTKIRTPFIDAFAEDSWLFENAYTPCPMTLPAHTTMLTGELPPEHGVRNNVGFVFDGRAHPSLPLLLKAHGYATGAAVSSYVLRSETGLGPLFDYYEDSIDAAPGDGAGALPPHRRQDRGFREGVDRKTRRGAVLLLLPHLRAAPAVRPPRAVPEPVRQRPTTARSPRPTRSSARSSRT